MKTFPPPQPLFTVRVRVPATTANLGPGFDALGLALDLFNEVELAGWDTSLAPPATVQVDGEGSTKLPLNSTNLVYQVAMRLMERAGVKVNALRVKLANRIPLARGLGSSSAAIVGALVAANAGLGNRFSREELLKFAVEEEGHPDNVAPALFGGLNLSVLAGGAVRSLRWGQAKLFAGLRAVVAVPYFELSTKLAREALPASVPHKDAVFSSSRAAMFVGAVLQKRYDLLGDAMEDRLHQPYRAKLVPGLAEVIAAARAAGAYGAALSGAGPSVLALTPPKAAAKVADAMTEAFRAREVTALSINLEVNVRGAQVLKATRRGAKG